MHADLEDRVVLVTGASGGIGQTTARAFAAEGASIVLHYHHNADAVERLRGQIAGTTLPVAADLRDEAQVDAVFAAIIDRFGRADAVVANAGIWPSEPVPVRAMSSRQWADTIEADLTSVFLTCRAFMRHLASVPRESGSIVLVGSTAALFGEADHADYAAAKAGLVYGLTRSLKNEIVRVCPRGRVNAVCPGWTDTPMARTGTSDPEVRRRSFATMSLRKIAGPQDVANAIVFLTSDRLAGHISGAILPITGGMEGRVVWGEAMGMRQ
ncbi:MAG: SDR family NAD(P)-dependent oxidoreductase [Planctomycetota bacterium]|jgi:3-oxoacyl-[acyl-carrier protein] reductase